MTSAEKYIFTELEAATLLSVTEENGVVTTIYVAPCTMEEDLLEPEFFPEDNQLMYHCPYCACAIRSAKAFKVHLMACRKNNKNKKEDDKQKKENEKDEIYQCIVCDQDFESIAHLYCHILVHETSFEVLRCGSCNVKFETDQEYQAHLKSHLEPEPEELETESSVTKSFDCILCGKHFLATFRLGHVTHRYACDNCLKNHKTKESNAIPTLPAQGKPEWTCDRCGRVYKLEGFLLRHKNHCQ
ncbi:hypothetical protein KR026_002758, partial [Drosophila bipectinata]